MSSDISRQRFNPANDFTSVLMQQGRVQLDADWNEWNEILDRHWRSETIDIIGRCVVPLETPAGFELQLSGGKMTIGRGRIYVHGLQAENHGAGDLEFDAILAESRGVDPLPYEKQPYFPKVKNQADLPEKLQLPKTGGPHLVYVDVWEREVTAVENPDLIENAVGVDTTSRLQTAWQVRVLPNVGDGATCATPDEQLKGWLDIIQPSAGRLTTKAVGVATSADPCLIPPSGGYRGLENRTYRVEIHDRGEIGTATFKWSRENASVASGVSAIEGDLTLTANRAVWDSVRRFSPGDWVEIADDWREFTGEPGEIRQIDSVDDSSRTITLKTALTAGLFPVDGQNLTDPARHTRIKRWDQDSSGPAVIEVPASGTPFILEDGVEVTFTTEPDDGAFRSGDYWIFVARTADASVEELDAAPPRGVHHHYCRLAIITFPDVVINCRTFWPPSFDGKGESCDCTICVSAEQHNQGAFTIQQAVNQLLKSGGTICLGPGVFNLVEKPVQLTGAFGVRIRGQGAATVIIAPRANAAFIIQQTQWCTLDYLTIHTIAGTTSGPGIRLSNSIGTTVERVIIGPPGEGNGPAAGLLLEAGFLLLTKIRDNFFRAQSGVTFAPKGNDDGALLLGSFYCERNLLQCNKSGIQLAGSSYYTSDTVVARNFIFGTGVAGISITGFALPELEITGNTITPEKGDGIVVGTGGVRIADNRVANVGADPQNGIRLVTGLLALALTPIVVSGNRLQGLRANGIAIEMLLVSAKIERNVLNAITGNGLIMLPGSAAGSMSVMANELINIANGTAEATTGGELAAIHLRNVFAGAVSENAISGVGHQASLAAVIAGIRADTSLDLRVSENTITNVAPPTDFQNPAAGVLVVGPLAHIDIAANLIRRQLTPNDDNSPWEAVRILGLSSEPAGKLQRAGFTNLSTQGQVNAISSLAASAAAVRAGVVNNTCHGYGRGPLTEVVITGSCRFSDNQCACASEKVAAVVEVTAEAVIAAENRVECGRNARSLDLKLGNAKALTVLGNIVGGPIMVNGAALSAPWQPLNVIGA
ncbi:MAG: Right handed beta helix region [Candidatus Udaeobacter sp.]|nr:MAG: Right handed beta helix region [Candidatus Udaeobacter sp.]